MRLNLMALSIALMGVLSPSHEAHAEMTLAQKAGQMQIIGYSGNELTPGMMELIQSDALGGFFLQIGDNFMLPKECAKLANAIQSAALESEHGIPLFIALDQEGGVAAPIHYSMGATPTPGNMALGASSHPEDTYAAYHAMGLDMRACGANMDFAPAIDELTQPANPDYTVRSFSSDMNRIAPLAAAAVRGLQEAHVVATAKHFPGLAWYTGDTHSVSPHVAATTDELMAGNLVHFRAAIEAGADAVMTVHATFDAWDSERPATLSSAVLTGVLRDKLGYEGIIITDSMGMGGITKKYDRGEATVMAVKAGCDMVLQVSRDVDEFHERVDALVKSVETGDISEDRIDISLDRIWRVKRKYGLFANARVDVDEVESKLCPPELLKANQRTALNGIVVVRDEQKLLPLSDTPGKVVVVAPPEMLTRAGKGAMLPVGPSIGAAVQERVPDAEVIAVDTIPEDDARKQALKKAAQADLLIAYSLLAWQSPGQVTFIKELLALNKPTIIVGLGMPSDLALFPEAKTFIAANSPAPISCEAAVKVVFGEAKPGGTLPVPIGDLYPTGFRGLLQADATR